MEVVGEGGSSDCAGRRGGEGALRPGATLHRGALAHRQIPLGRELAVGLGDHPAHTPSSAGEAAAWRAGRVPRPRRPERTCSRSSALELLVQRDLRVGVDLEQQAERSKLASVGEGITGTVNEASTSVG